MGFSKKEVIGDSEKKPIQGWVGTEVRMPRGRVRMEVKNWRQPL